MKTSEIFECVLFAGSDSAGPGCEDLQTGADTTTSSADLLWRGLVWLQQTEHRILPAKGEVLLARFMECLATSDKILLKKKPLDWLYVIP